MTETQAESITLTIPDEIILKPCKTLRAAMLVLAWLFFGYVFSTACEAGPNSPDETVLIGLAGGAGLAVSAYIVAGRLPSQRLRPALPSF